MKTTLFDPIQDLLKKQPYSEIAQIDKHIALLKHPEFEPKHCEVTEELFAFINSGEKGISHDYYGLKVILVGHSKEALEVKPVYTGD